MLPDFLRKDDSFIMRFLRARKFHIYDAFRLYARYFEYRAQNRNLFKKFSAAEKDIKSALMDGFPGVLPARDHFGRKVIIFFASNWDNHRYGLASIYRALLLTLEKLVEDEETQVNGVVIIIDWSQFSFKQSTWINPKILKLMIEGLQVSGHKTHWSLGELDVNSGMQFSTLFFLLVSSDIILICFQLNAMAPYRW